MDGILSFVFALGAVLSLWVLFGGFVFLLYKNGARNKKAKRFINIMLAVFLFFFIAWGILRNINMPIWNM